MKYKIIYMYVIIYSDVLFPRGLRIFFIFTFLLSLISILRPGLINVDFADVRTIMGDAGTALMGIGRGSGMLRMFLLRALFLGIFFFFFLEYSEETQSPFTFILY